MRKTHAHTALRSLPSLSVSTLPGHTSPLKLPPTPSRFVDTAQRSLSETVPVGLAAPVTPASPPASLASAHNSRLGSLPALAFVLPCLPQPLLPSPLPIPAAPPPAPTV